MSKQKKIDIEKQEEKELTINSSNKPDISEIGWTDYVLGLLSEDEKIKGNPTTDGLRRIFETAMCCRITNSCTQVVQSPSPDNEKRATVIHSITFYLNDGGSVPNDLNIVSVDGSADVYWGNCDKIYRNHPVAVAETRAEGRALRRALRLRKVVAAEELAEEMEDNPDSNSVSKISNNQINFIDVMSKRLNINAKKLLENANIEHKDIYNIQHEQAVSIIRILSKYQQDVSSISEDIQGYVETWKE